MSKVFATLTLFTIFAVQAFAGDVVSKEAITTAPQDPESFAPGFEFGAYAAGALPNGSAGDELGGGISMAYYFTENIGVDMSYAVFPYSSEVHAVTADLALRAPANCISPYVLMGGGLISGGTTDGLYRLGGGLDIRFQNLGNMGVFADGVYNWVEGDNNFTIARLGVRIPF
tara:strand:+ start:6564 stop:7079 length:516 start_codon:yes stop_codon:yes gene_type:complete